MNWKIGKKLAESNTDKMRKNIEKQLKDMKERKALTCFIVGQKEAREILGRGKVEQNWGKPAIQRFKKAKEIMQDKLKIHI